MSYIAAKQQPLRLVTSRIIANFAGEMKRLLQVNTTMGRTAPGLIADELDRLATAAGWDCHLAYGRPGPMADEFDPASRHRLASTAEVAWHGAMTRLADRHGLHSAAATRRLCRLIDKLQPDVVHLHNIHGYYLHYPLLFSYLRERQQPVLWTLHDLWPLTGHCAFFATDRCEQLAQGCVGCPRKNVYPGSLLLSRAQANFRQKQAAFAGLHHLHLVAVSHYVADLIPDSILSQYPVTTIYNGVDIPADQPTPTTTPGRPLALGVAYRWDERKGLADFHELRRRLPDNWRIRLIGLTKPQIASLPQGIEGCERVDTLADLRRHYADATVLVSLSHGESLGMVSLEAQACGTPVVMYDAGGCSETIAPDTGLAVARGDVAAAARACQAIADRPTHFTPQACRANIATHFDRTANFTKYLTLYNTLTN